MPVREMRYEEESWMSATFNLVWEKRFAYHCFCAKQSLRGKWCYEKWVKTKCTLFFIELNYIKHKGGHEMKVLSWKVKVRDLCDSYLVKKSCGILLWGQWGRMNSISHTSLRVNMSTWQDTWAWTFITAHHHIRSSERTGIFPDWQNTNT